MDATPFRKIGPAPLVPLRSASGIPEGPAARLPGQRRIAGQGPASGARPAATDPAATGPLTRLRSRGAGSAPITALVLAALLAGSATSPLWAESGLTFRLGLRAESESNATLNPAQNQPRHGASLRFGLDLYSETPISRLGLTFSGGLDSWSGLGSTRKGGLADPSLALSYERGVSDAGITLGYRHSQTDLGTVDPGDPDEGIGRRRSDQLSGRIDWRKDAPLGFGLSAGAERHAYEDAPAERDYRSERLGLHIRADLTEVLQARLDLQSRLHRYTDGLGSDRRTTSADLALALARPTGNLSLSLGLDDAPEGQRSRLSFGQAVELPRGNLNWSLGATRGTDGDTHATGSLGWTHELPQGQIGVTLSRAVTSSGSADAETLQDRLSLRWSQEMTETGQLSLGLSWSGNTDTATDLRTVTGQVSAIWTQELGEDWGLDVGYVHRMRDRDLVGKADSDRLFLELRRDFRVKF